MDSPNGTLVRLCFRILNAKSIGLTITLADITEEEFRVLELIEAEGQEQIKSRLRTADASVLGRKPASVFSRSAKGIGGGPHVL